ncbi:MAG: hypothetical protein ACREOO_14390 [bacterium]
MIDELGSPGHVFFDLDSHLWAGKVILDPRSHKGETVRVLINEWKKVGEVKLPSKVTATDKSGDWILDFHVRNSKASGCSRLLPRRMSR